MLLAEVATHSSNSAGGGVYESAVCISRVIALLFETGERWGSGNQ